MTLPRGARASNLAAGLLFFAVLPVAGLAQGSSNAKVQPTPAPVSARRRSQAEAAYLQGAKQLQTGDLLHAEQSYARAVTLDPAKPEYTQGLLLTREHHVSSLLQQAAQQRSTDSAKADALIAEARAFDSSNPRVVQRDAGPTVPQGISSPVRQTRAASAITLKPNAGCTATTSRATPATWQRGLQPTSVCMRLSMLTCQRNLCALRLIMSASSMHFVSCPY